MSKEVILTGLRSNAEFHLGNYLGAILPMVELQKKHAGKYQLNMFIPDLHSFTTPVSHGSLYEQSLQNLKAFVAAGLDINQPDTYIYRQSYIPAHSELTWILDCFTGVGTLERMTQYKEKVRQLSKLNVKEYNEAFAWKEHDTSHLKSAQKQFFDSHFFSAGLFNYPVLMAADILLYGAKWVPVGEDQRQHVEFTRDLAIRMNNKFGELFVVPEDNDKQNEFADRDEPVRIRSLRFPEQKMSKSVDDPSGTILLTDNPDDAVRKIMSATTDTLNSIEADYEKQPGVTNLLTLLKLLNRYPGNYSITDPTKIDDYKQLKKAVATTVKNFLSDFQAKLIKIDETQLLEKLEADEKAMNEIANATLLKIQRAVGLRPRD